MGEGAAVVILEELEAAKKRGAKIFGEVLGYGSTADAYRITDIHPEGRGAIGCMRQAIADAKLNLSDIGYVNAHGTSTTVNDRTENASLQICLRRFGTAGPSLKHQKHDGTFDCRCWCYRDDRLPVGDA